MLSQSLYEDAVSSETRALQRFADDEDCAGIVLWHLCGSANVAALQELRRRNKKVAFVDRKPPKKFEADYVGVTNALAAENAVNHLISLGYRQIVFLTSPDQASSIQERQEGYLTALCGGGIVFRPEWILNGEFLMSPAPNGEAVVALYLARIIHERS